MKRHFFYTYEDITVDAAEKMQDNNDLLNSFGKSFKAYLKFCT